jgi:hypothetical protein
MIASSWLKIARAAAVVCDLAVKFYNKCSGHKLFIPVTMADEMEKLIDLVSNCSYLFDTRHGEYKNTEK